MTPLSAHRRQLLIKVSDAGGIILGRDLTVPERRLATQMAKDRLVRWERGLGSVAKCKGTWRLSSAWRVE